ncbi:MAG: D-alanyl-D-alanine carboxypeptidase [Clostridia bacterium]|nr:D-alanyl-D-alanine carboxypeptidase [Clostridia bacterium]
MKKQNLNKKLFIIIAITLFSYIISCIVTYDKIDRLPGLYGQTQEVSGTVKETEKNFSPQEAIKKLLKISDIMDDVRSLKVMEEPSLEAKNAIIMDNKTNRVLFEKEPDEQVAMASTTKIMTFLIVAEHCNIDEKTTVSRQSATIGGSSMHLKAGEVISIEALLYGLLLNSGNDAAGALAEHVSGSIESFCALMNEKARIIGAYNTHFTSPHGLDNDEHYTTCYDLALITKAAVKNPLFIKIISTQQITVNNHFLTNTNPLLGQYPEVTGGKTGYTSKAGRCLVLYVNNEDVSAIIVLLGSPSSGARITDGIACTKYVTNAFKTYTIESRNCVAGSIKVNKGIINSVNLVGRNDINLTLCAKDFLYADYTVLYRFDGTMTAPVSSSVVLMEIYIYSHSTLLGVIKCGPSSCVPRKSYTNHLSDVLETFPRVFT